MLEPIFGATGAVVAQYIITLIVILGLVGLVVWLVRRYAVGGTSTNVRGRMPRLAIVDALVVDNRHRLVLIRRDNVEHLVLIGGSTDLLIEPSIVRTRVPQRPAQPAPQARAAAAATAPPVPPPAPPAPAMPAPPIRRAEETAEGAIPSPPRGPRAAGAPRPGRGTPIRAPHRPGEAAVEAAPREPVMKRPAVEAERTTAEEDEPAAAAPPRPTTRLSESLFPAEPEVELPLGNLGESPSTAPEVEAPAAAVEQASAFAPPRHRPGAERATPAADTAPAEDAGAAPPGPAPKVSDLEREMARLLGEISSSRSS